MHMLAHALGALAGSDSLLTEAQYTQGGDLQMLPTMADRGMGDFMLV